MYMNKGKYKTATFILASAVILIALWRYPEVAVGAVAGAFVLLTTILGSVG